MAASRSKTFVFGSTPINDHLSTKYTGSTAYLFCVRRTDFLLDRLIQDLDGEKSKAVMHHGKGSAEELKHIIGLISKLKSEVQTNKKLTPLDACAKDADLWNRLLETEKGKRNGQDLTWFDCPFLYADCYFYRRISALFELSKTLSTYDPYLKQKDEALMGSIESIKSLSKYCNAINKKIPRMGKEEVNEETKRFFQVCMWGNECDLALAVEGVGNKIADAVQQAVDKRENILVNDLDRICNLLNDMKTKSLETGCDVVVDIIMDNAGFELVSDLCLADWLITSTLVNTVRFHVKNMPWFISDTNSQDIAWVLGALEMTGSEDVLVTLSRWKNHFSCGTWVVIEDEHFWTLPFSYHEMPLVDPDLYNKLSATTLLIFKGDLNYRKLLGDINWKFSTPFEAALKTFSPAPLVALRAVKTELLVGVDPAIVLENNKRDPEWMLKGSHGVIQLHVP